MVQKEQKKVSLVRGEHENGWKFLTWKFHKRHFISNFIITHNIARSVAELMSIIIISFD